MTFQVLCPPPAAATLRLSPLISRLPSQKSPDS
jgi:hypothetical protein